MDRALICLTENCVYNSCNTDKNNCFYCTQSAIRVVDGKCVEYTPMSHNSKCMSDETYKQMKLDDYYNAIEELS